MDTNTYNCSNIDTYTDIYPILFAGCVLALTHLFKFAPKRKRLLIFNLRVFIKE